MCKVGESNVSAADVDMGVGDCRLQEGTFFEWYVLKQVFTFLHLI